MKKNFKRILSRLLASVFVFQLMTTHSLAEEQVDTDVPKVQSVEVKKKPYLTDLVQNNDMIKSKVKDLEEEGMIIDEKVATILLNDEKSDVLYYHNQDKTIIGMVQFIENYKTELRVFLNEDRETVSKSIFTNSDGTMEVLNVSNDEVISEYNPGITTLGISPHICNVFVSLAGDGISAIYAAAATAALGPAAGIIIGLIHTYGWSYVTDQCSK